MEIREKFETNSSEYKEITEAIEELEEKNKKFQMQQS